MPGYLAQEWGLLDGFWLSVTGMLIVFVALVLVTLFIGWLPRALACLNAVFPESPDHHPPPQRRSAGEKIDDEVVVAIAAVLDARRRK